MDDGEIVKLRARLVRRVRGRGKRYPVDLKQRIGRVAAELRHRGQGWQRIGRFLGIPHETVRRFAGATAVAPFVPVEVVGEMTAGLALVCPGGYRVEGLLVADVAEILRQLR
jgi:hypothetical protein